MAARNTVQKAIIRDALVGLANHPTADQVYEGRSRHASFHQ